jgi:hypothetical protein
VARRGHVDELRAGVDKCALRRFVAARIYDCRVARRRGRGGGGDDQLRAHARRLEYGATKRLDFADFEPGTFVVGGLEPTLRRRGHARLRGGERRREQRRKQRREQREMKQLCHPRRVYSGKRQVQIIRKGRSESQVATTKREARTM